MNFSHKYIFTFLQQKEAVNKAIMEWDPTYERKYFDDESIDLCSKLLNKDQKKDLVYLVVKK